MRAGQRFIALVPLCLAALGATGCGAAPTLAPEAPSTAPSADPTRFSAERFEASVRALVDFGARAPGSEALANARRWAETRTPTAQSSGTVVLAAPLATGDVSGAALAEESSAAALVLEAARVLEARGEAPALALLGGEIPPTPPLAGAELAVYVRRACGMPQRRDLLSHRVLRERFFRAAADAPVAFEHADAPHAALLAAGAKRVVALDSPKQPGASCEPVAFGEALVRFVTDSTALLSRGGSNFEPPGTSQSES